MANRKRFNDAPRDFPMHARIAVLGTLDRPVERLFDGSRALPTFVQVLGDDQSPQIHPGRGPTTFQADLSTDARRVLMRHGLDDPEPAASR